MLSPHNVHRNIFKIHNAGADVEKIVNAVAIEMAKDSTRRAQQIAKNALLIRRSNGLLAPINGSERYLTVGAGHTCAGCKHADAGGKTPIPELQCEDGSSIDTPKLKKKCKFCSHDW